MMRMNEDGKKLFTMNVNGNKQVKTKPTNVHNHTKIEQWTRWSFPQEQVRLKDNHIRLLQDITVREITAHLIKSLELRYSLTLIQ